MRRASTTKKHCRIRCDLLPMPCRPGVVPLILVLVLSSQVCHVVNAWMLHPNVHKSLALTSQSHLQSYAKDSVRNNDVLARLRTRKPLTPLHSSIKYEAVAINSTDEHLETMNRSFPSEYEVYQNQKLDLQLILLDNYDSYTYNIYSYLSTMCKKPPIVVSNDAYDSWKDLIQDVGAVDGIVISPGPGRPERKEDMGICLEAIGENPDLPILGICLGHQALGYHYDAEVKLAPFGPVHGLSSNVSYVPLDDRLHAENDANFDSLGDEQIKKCDLFKGIPQSFDVVRYHSLVVEFPSESEQSNLAIEPIAWCMSDTDAENGNGEICMALQHKVNPHYGVQFHPESVGTGEFGYRILRNFCEFCVDRCHDIKYVNGNISAQAKKKGVLKGAFDDALSGVKPSDSKHKIYMHKISKADKSLPSPEVVFENLFASMDDSFWLDSSTGRKDADLEERKKPSAFGRTEGCPIDSNSRFSILGGNLGRLCKKVEYWGKDHKIENRGLFVTEPGDGTRRRIENSQDIISYLRGEILTNGVTDTVTEISFDATDTAAGHTNSVSESVPFGFRGGFVGYLGYEVRHDTRNLICEQEACGVAINDKEPDGSSNPMVPTAAFLFADRSLVYDHWRDEWYLLGVVEASDSSNEIVEWVRETTVKVTALSTRDELQSGKKSLLETDDDLQFNLKRSKDEYSADIERCHKEIKNGESYELCLTNQLSTRVSFREGSSNNLSCTPFGLYKILRSRNPAPFAAFLNFDRKKSHPQNESSVSICCSSPERFLSVTKHNKYPTNSYDDANGELDHGWEFSPPFVSKNDDTASRFIVESKPIKGTASRIITSEDDPDFDEKLQEDEKAAEELQRSSKNRAENLMIVDLLRNDLSRVCEAGSVHVPKLMGIESFATVHQMVSTIRGIVDEKHTPIDVISASFPGGSMTGAPKLRSVDILDELELGNSRGPYSGCLGYISLNGSMDMNIVIRTAVVTPSSDVEKNENLSWDVKIGAGGAITALSESEDEFEEMLLKASAIKKSVQQWYSGGR